MEGVMNRAERRAEARRKGARMHEESGGQQATERVEGASLIVIRLLHVVGADGKKGTRIEIRDAVGMLSPDPGVVGKVLEDMGRAMQEQAGKLQVARPRLIVPGVN